jgi:hypothetical protein
MALNGPGLPLAPHVQAALHAVQPRLAPPERPRDAAAAAHGLSGPDPRARCGTRWWSWGVPTGSRPTAGPSTVSRDLALRLFGGICPQLPSERLLGILL